MLRKVAVLAVPTMAPFEFGVLCEVFGVDRTDDGVPPIDFTVVAADPGTIPFQYGLSVTVPSGLEAARDADLVAVPAVDDLRRVDPRILETVRAAHERGAWVLSVCSGAFVLGAAGLLDGRPS
ncbi:MAG TPA: DJ-1/PfpI family protein, partial [Amnibacterium sp.]